MTDVLYVPKLTSNLFSVNAATLKGNVISFVHKYCWIRNKKKKLIGTGSLMGKLYILNYEVSNSPANKATIAGETEGSGKINLWQQRLAYVNVKQLQQLVKNSEGVDLQPEGKRNFCEVCVHGMMHWLPHTALKDINPKRDYNWYTPICVGQCKPSHLAEIVTSLLLLMTILITVGPTSWEKNLRLLKNSRK